MPTFWNNVFFDVFGANGVGNASANPAVTGITAGSNQKTFNLGSSYDFGVFKLLGIVVHDTRTDLKETRGAVSASIPIGAAEVHLGYSRSKLTNDLAHNTNINSSYQASYL